MFSLAATMGGPSAALTASTLTETCLEAPMTAKRICSIDGCGKPHYGRGWCSAHYQRWRLHGGPAEGNASRGATQEFIRKAADYTGTDCLLWPYGRSNGYGNMVHNGQRIRAHRLVLQLATGEPGDGLDAAHTPGIGCQRLCVNPGHLRWATNAENHADMLIDDTTTRGERSSSARLTESDVLAIREDPRLHREIAADYGVVRSNISTIKARRSWSWL